jgi:hypothetical protein
MIAESTWTRSRVAVIAVAIVSSPKSVSKKAPKGFAVDGWLVG